ncbi:cadherin domain-containing protein [Sediminicola luteus]|nr:cadherin domain-containing protein [Sediminicola luteus]
MKKQIPQWLLVLFILVGTIISCSKDDEAPNTAPEIEEQAFSIAEDVAANASVGRVEATDAESDELTFAITTNDDNAFTINESTGELSVSESASIDYETKTSYTLTITVNDGELDASSTITVNITDVAENVAPVVAAQSFNLSEDTGAGALIGTIIATDENADPLSFTISINDDDAVSIDGSTGELFLTDSTTLDFETKDVYTITVLVSDGELETEVNITINITDVDENTAPVMVAQEFSLVENTGAGFLVGTIVATDDGTEPLSFAIKTNDDDAFTLDESSGEIFVSNTGSFDYETKNVYSLVVVVSDGVFETEAVVTINITDVDENTAPVVTAQTFSIAEDSASGIAIGTVMATDAESNTLSFSIKTNDDDAFEINTSTGELTLATSSNLDFETKNSYTIVVVVSDGVLETEATVTIAITDVEDNTAPAVDAQTFNIAEDSASGTAIGTVIATDAESNTLSFSIKTNDDDAFEIDEATGELSLSSTATIDFETKNEYTIVVLVSDGTLETEATISILVTDVAENTAPTVANTSFTINEGLAAAVVFGNINATDPDQGQSLNYSITTNSNGIFAISNTGDLSIASGMSVNYNTAASHTITVSVTDGIDTTTADITINVAKPVSWDDALIIDFTVTSANATIQLPTLNVPGFDFHVDWGDGSIENDLTNTANHTFSAPGTYTVKITGVLPMLPLSRSNGTTKAATIDIKQWGNIKWRVVSSMFAGLKKLIISATDAPDLSRVNRMDNMFQYCVNFNSNISHWDVSRVEHMNGTFAGTHKFTGDLSNWDVSRVKTFGGMFQFRNNSATHGIENWNVSSAENLSYMFSDSNFNGDISGWNTSGVKFFTGIFSNNKQFNQDISGWNVKKGTQFINLFKGATAFNQDLGDWNVYSATTLNGMFSNSGMSRANYMATLEGWATDTMTVNNMSLSADGLIYCNSMNSGRTNLINNKGWTFSGDTEDCSN